MTIEYTEAYTSIGAEDFDTTVAFYVALLGREPDERVRDIYVSFHLPGLRLGIFKPRGGHASEFRNPPDRRGGLSLVLRVADLEQASAELVRLGSPEPGPVMETSHGREAYAYDPGGNRIILVERVR